MLEVVFFMKCVGIQKGLNDIKERLEQEGIEVADINDPSKYFSAMVYSNEINNYGEIYDKQFDDQIKAGMGTGEGYVLMLNAAEMTTDEIINRIKVL